MLPRSGTSPSATGTIVSRKAKDSDDEDENPETDGRDAEDIGKSYTYRNVLSAVEAAALESFKRRDRDDEEAEVQPLPSKQRNATYGDIRQPLRSRSLGGEAEALCIATSHTGNMLAVGGRRGTVQLLNPSTLEVMDTLALGELAAGGARSGGTAAGGSNASSASGGARTADSAAAGGRGENGKGGAPSRDGVVTAVAFRPDLAGSTMQNLLLAAQGDTVVHVHAGTRRVLHTAREEGNQINALAVRQDGQVFASAGSDGVVRVYDEGGSGGAGGPRCVLDHGDGISTSGHTNHVFALAWQPEDPQVLLSGGWDNHVLVWDLRVQRSVRSIFGPYICGAALDVRNGTVLTGSWRHSKPLQLWDLGSGRLLTNLPWWQPAQDACLPYAAAFGTGAAAGRVVAGGSGAKPMIRVYDLKAPGDVELVATVMPQRPVHALAVLPPAAAAAGGKTGGGAAAAWGGDAMAIVCCDTEVHAVALLEKESGKGPK